MSRAYNNEFSCIIVYGSKSCMFITQYSIPNFHGYLQHAYRKTRTRDPSGTLADPRKTVKPRPYKNQKTGTRDTSVTLVRP